MLNIYILPIPLLLYIYIYIMNHIFIIIIYIYMYMCVYMQYITCFMRSSRIKSLITTAPCEAQLSSVKIFARLSPFQKEQIIQVVWQPTNGIQRLVHGDPQESYRVKSLCF
jgi:hypothetical protein